MTYSERITKAPMLTKTRVMEYHGLYYKQTMAGDSVLWTSKGYIKKEDARKNKIGAGGEWC